MVRALKMLAWPAVLITVLLAGMGCPPYTPPDYLASFLLTPSSLDFGADEDSLELKVAKNFTSQPLPEFTISPGTTSWLSVSPKTGSSSGPDDPATITVTVDRSKMAVGTNSGSLIISAPGVADQEVPVTAKALLVADFSATPLLADVNEKVDFVDESSAAPGAGTISSWLWTFGDNKQSTSQNPRHKYTNPGTYTVTLTVQTSGANALSDTQVRQNYITVEDTGGPTADFIASDTTPPANTPVDFTDLSDPGDDTIVSWFWTFGDGGTSSDQSPTHTYLLKGKYTVSLTVTTDTGAEDTATKNKYIDVQSQGPTAQFVGSPRTIAAGETVQFSDLSDAGSSPITSWFWDFGDGNTITGTSTPTHIYSAAGAYSVYLAVTTDVGSDGILKTNYITVTP